MSITQNMFTGGSAVRPASNLAARVRILLARIYLAFDESQRRRAAAVIHRYKHLIPDHEKNSNGESKIG